MRNVVFLSIGLVMLSACTYVQEQPNTLVNENKPLIEPEKRIEEVEIADVSELLTGTGALAERLLPTGIIDIGDREASVTLLLFTEHHARYAREFQEEHFPRLLKDFIEPGYLRFQLIILPLKKYPQSNDAAKGLMCAAMQGKGMLMHTTLSQKLDRERLPPRDYAQDIGLDMEKFSACMGTEEIDIILDQQKSLAQSLGVTLVPTFFLNGEKKVGLPYYSDLRGMILQILES